jgi:hypothetical protein
MDSRAKPAALKRRQIMQAWARFCSTPVLTTAKVVAIGTAV